MRLVAYGKRKQLSEVPDGWYNTRSSNNTYDCICEVYEESYLDKVLNVNPDDFETLRYDFDPSSDYYVEWPDRNVIYENICGALEGHEDRLRQVIPDMPSKLYSFISESDTLIQFQEGLIRIMPNNMAMVLLLFISHVIKFNQLLNNFNAESLDAFYINFPEFKKAIAKLKAFPDVSTFTFDSVNIPTEVVLDPLIRGEEVIVRQSGTISYPISVLWDNNSRVPYISNPEPPIGSCDCSLCVEDRDSF